MIARTQSSPRGLSKTPEVATSGAPSTSEPQCKSYNPLTKHSNTDDDDDDDDDNDEKKSNSKRQKRKEISPLKPVKIEDEGMGISI